jgi:hypothetical protein
MQDPDDSGILQNLLSFVDNYSLAENTKKHILSDKDLKYIEGVFVVTRNLIKRVIYLEERVKNLITETTRLVSDNAQIKKHLEEAKRTIRVQELYIVKMQVKDKENFQELREMIAKTKPSHNRNKTDELQLRIK